MQLAEAVIELAKAGKPFTKENLDATYVTRRRASWVDAESKIAEKARDGFNAGFLRGLIGMGVTGLTRGMINIPGHAKRPHERIPTIERYFGDRIPQAEIKEIRRQCQAAGLPLHDALMDRSGWPKIELDGTLGAGKTTWVRHLLRALGVQGTIKSPSYTVVETYDTAAGPVAHFDFYRFQDPHEWEDAGLRDVYGEPGIKVAEWPEKAQGLLPEPDLRLRIRTPALPGESADAPGTEAGREVTLEAHTALGQRLLA